MNKLNLNKQELELFEIITRLGFLTHIKTATLNKTEQSLKTKLMMWLKNEISKY